MKIMLVIITVFMLSLLASPQITEPEEEKIPIDNNFFQPVIEKLYTLGADSTFVFKLANDTRVQFNEKYCKIGVPIKKGGSSNKYKTHYNATAVKKTKEFIKENTTVLDSAESTYGIPKEIIAALLYVETRHGNYLGNHNVASVYMSLAMADQPKYIKMNLKNLREKHKDKSPLEMEELESKLMKRTETKSSWAIDQLLALNIIDTCCYDALELHGSYAGAFGISQFIPESYIEWAVDGNGDSVVNLYDIDDAIFSAANYLKLHGWTENPKDQYKAIWGYNHSDAYVKAIQTLARKIK